MGRPNKATDRGASAAVAEAPPVVVVDEVVEVEAEVVDVTSDEAVIEASDDAEEVAEAPPVVVVEALPDATVKALDALIPDDSVDTMKMFLGW